MPPFDAAPVGRPFLGQPGPAEDRPRPRHRPTHRRLPEGGVPALFLVAITLLGGAGASYPLLTMAVELLSLGLLAQVACRPGAILRIGKLEWMVLGLIVAVPLAQLVPLPATWWSRLPGRALPRDILLTVGIAPGAMPLSLAPAATLRAALALAPGVALFVAARAEGAAGRLTAVRTVVGLAVLSACLGAAQIAGGAGTLSFQSAHAGQAIGLFVNRNHQAALLLVAIVLTPAAWQRAGGPTPLAAGATAALLAAATVATTSRTALVLLPFCLIPTLWPMLRRSPRAAAAVLAGVAAAMAAAWWQGSLPRLLARFGTPELRPEIWRTSWAAVLAYFPGGAGVGAFRSVYPLFERREAVTPFLVNHAHDDALELLIEGGAVAALGLALFAWWFARRSLAARRVRGLVPAALGGVAVLLAWSAVDYPLRTLALAALFGLLCGLADPPPDVIGGKRRPFLLLLIVPLALLVAKEGWAAHRLLADGPPRDPRQALTEAPLDQRALGAWALARQQAGDPAAARGWTLAARLGWRDPATQVILTARDADAGDMAGAVGRADALLRQGRFDPTLLAMLRLGAGEPRFARALAAMLGREPDWRERYMMRLDALDADAVARHAALLRTMLTAGVPVRADEMAALVERASAVERDDVARGGWALLTGGAGAGDPTLAAIDASWRARRAIGGWHRTALPGLDPLPGGGVEVDRSIAGTLLYQELFLAPGRYRLGVEGQAADAVRWRVSCGDQGLDARPVGVSLVVTVPPGCGRQRLALDGIGGGIGSVRLRFRVTLTPN